MNTRDRLALASMALFMGAICLVVWMPRSSPPDPGITDENLEKINPRMTLADVEKILGERSRSTAGAIMGGSFFWGEYDDDLVTVWFKHGRATAWARWRAGKPDVRKELTPAWWDEVYVWCHSWMR